LTVLDKRLAAYRPDLADVRLRGQVEATRFIEGRLARIIAPVADMRGKPSLDAGMSTQLLMGTEISVFDEDDGFAWVQSRRDFYVGYVASADIGPMSPAPTHRVIAPRSFVYSGADLRLPRTAVLSMGTELTIVGKAETRGTTYALLDDGRALIAAHLATIDALAEDYVAVAETLIHTPYLWGGSSAFGIDCSGLVQLAMRMTGRDAPRDSDMQASGLGAELDPGPGNVNLRRGDLVFWKGHVAIMTDPKTMIHANGHTMLVSREGLAEAIDRIGYLYGGPTGFRRP
jgi:cell wall-associated NlpC family hydrolase